MSYRQSFLAVVLCACQVDPSPKTVVTEDEETIEQAGATTPSDPAPQPPAPPPPPAPITPQSVAGLNALGGQVLSVDGRVSLMVPPLALTDSTNITIEKASLATSELGTDVYDLGPAGQTFTRDVELCFSGVTDTEPSGKCLGYKDKNNAWKCEDECVTKKGDGKLCGHTSHFTNFAILLQGGSQDECSSSYFGAEGGTLSSPDKLASVTVEKGGLYGEEGARIRVVRSSSLKQPGSGVYDFLPNGLSFQKAATVCLTLAEGVKSDTACLGYYDEQNKKWVCEDTCLKSKESKLCGKTDHFTNFAILLTGGNGTKCK